MLARQAFVNAGLRPPPPAAVGVDKSSPVRHRAFDGKERLSHLSPRPTPPHPHQTARRLTSDLITRFLAGVSAKINKEHPSMSKVFLDPMLIRLTPRRANGGKTCRHVYRLFRRQSAIPPARSPSSNASFLMILPGPVFRGHPLAQRFRLRLVRRTGRTMAFRQSRAAARNSGSIAKPIPCQINMWFNWASTG